MTVKQIALSAAAILQADDIEELLSGDDTALALDDADVKTLVKCVALAVGEAAADAPVIKTVTLKSTGGSISPEMFDGGLFAIKSVTHAGHAVRFGLDSRGVKLDRDGEYTVCYVSPPTDTELDGDVALGVGMTVDTVAMLAARNYCLVTGRTDEASVWDQRYAAEAERVRLVRRATMPGRRWI